MNESDVPNYQESPRLGPYRITAEVSHQGGIQTLRGKNAEGGNFLIHLIEDSAFIRPPHPQALQEFLDRLRACRSPHVLPCVDSGYSPDGELYLVYEYLRGPSLDQLIRDRVQLAERQRADLLSQAASGLDEMARQGLHHFKLSPASFVVESRSHQVKILDAGLRQLLWNGETVPENFEPDPAQAPYLPPEMRPGAKLGGAADCYGLGASFYHLFTGQAPPSAGAQPPAEVNPEVSSALSMAVMRLIAPDPAARFQNGGELIQLLEDTDQGSAPPRPMQELEELESQDSVEPSPSPLAEAPDMDPDAGLSAASVSSPAGEGGVAVDVSDLPIQELRPAPWRNYIVLGCALLLAMLVIGALISATRSSGEGEDADSGDGLLQSLVTLVLPSTKSSEDDPQRRNYLDTAEKLRYAARMAGLYAAQTGRRPAAIESLVERGYLEPGEQEDAWGREFVLHRSDGRVVSLGEDGEEFTSDDWQANFEGELVVEPQQYREYLSEEDEYSRKGWL